MLRFKSLGSGSSGNATVVEARDGHQTVRVLIDCGLGAKTLATRLGQAGLEGSQIDAVFITHEHSDHIGSARQFALRHHTPVWMSQGTYAAIGEPDFAGWLRQAQDGAPIDLGGLQLTPFAVPHDAREPLQVRCSDGARHLGVLTDLGHAPPQVLAHLAGCDALLLECNHDDALLANSAYPAFLKKRVGGQHGHLSNAQAQQIAAGLNHGSLGHVVAAHLSRQNNRPDLACAALAQALDRSPADILAADASTGCAWLTV